jgi:hypothetical protein
MADPIDTTSPRRRKPWYRPRNAVLAILLVVLIALGWGFREAWKVYTAEPNPTVDYRAEFRRMSEDAAGVPRGSGAEAWAILMDALKITDETFNDIEHHNQEAGFTPRDDSDHGELDFVTFLLEGHTISAEATREREVLGALRDSGVPELLDRFANLAPGFKPIEAGGPLIAEETPPALSAIDLAKALAASMRIATEHGDWDETVRIFNQLLAIGRTYAHQIESLCWFVGTAIYSLALEELRLELNEHDFGETAARACLHAIDERSLPSSELPVEAYRCTFLDTIQHVFSDDGHGNGYLLPDGGSLDLWSSTGLGGFRSAAAARFQFTDRRTSEQLVNEFLDGILQRSRAPTPEEKQAAFDRDEFLAALDRRPFTIVQLLLHNVKEPIQEERPDRLHCEATRLVLALEIHYARHGEYPATLDALIPDILPSIPDDPRFGTPFGYRRLDHDPAGRPYLLYSFGADRRDNGGAFDASEPYTALTGERDDVDFILNPPRPERDAD